MFTFKKIWPTSCTFDIDFDFREITEPRISKTNFSPRNITLANYAIEQTPTESNTGGALLYINRKRSYKIRKDLKLYKPYKIEYVFVESIMPKRTNVIVWCIYRHSDNDTDDFNTNYQRSLLQKLSKESSKNFFLLCDFNIDLLNSTVAAQFSIFWMNPHQVILHPKFFFHHV